MSKDAPSDFVPSRLIAVAPDLLAAAKLALQIAEEVLREELYGTIRYARVMAKLDSVRDVIDKAERTD